MRCLFISLSIGFPVSVFRLDSVLYCFCTCLHEAENLDYKLIFTFSVLCEEVYFLIYKTLIRFPFLFNQIFSNFLSSVIIHTTRPFIANDWIRTKIQGYEVSGTVEVCSFCPPVTIQRREYSENILGNYDLQIHANYAYHYFGCCTSLIFCFCKMLVCWKLRTLPGSSSIFFLYCLTCFSMWGGGRQPS